MLFQILEENDSIILNLINKTYIPALKSQIETLEQAYPLHPNHKYLIPKNLTTLTLKYAGKSGLFNLEFSNHRITCRVCGNKNDDIEKDIPCFNNKFNKNFSLSELKSKILDINLDSKYIYDSIDTINQLIKELYDIDPMKLMEHKNTDNLTT